MNPGTTDANTYIGLAADDSNYQFVATREGNVGIGNSSPTYKLNVNLYNGSATANVMSLLGSGNVGIASTTPWAKLSVTNTGSGPSFIVEDATSPDSTPFIIDASGNVGIATTSPWRTLSVTGTVGVHLGTP